MSVIDLSQPLSAILREGTKKAHQEVETSAGAAALLKGELPKEEYVRFLMMLWHVYDTFEKALERHQANPILEPTYNPALLARAPALSADIAYILSIPESSWKSHPIHEALQASRPQALTDYVNAVNSISDSNDPAPLLAHAYVRYLGDLSGGQTIQRALGKAYHLTPNGPGLEFYKFKELTTNKQATIGEMKRIKDWFRAGMDKGAGDNMDAKAAIMDEASRVFEYNGALFRAISTEKPKVVYSKPEEGTGSKTYSVASVVSFILALCIAHFALTVGGFTGERGYEKLVAVEQWLGGRITGTG